MHSGNQESCTSQTSQDFGEATSTNIPSTTPSDIAPINKLLDEVLLEIFACYEEIRNRYYSDDVWHTLARVCRRWRSIALGSPRRLNLRIFCTERTPVRKKLDFWPPFPIVLSVSFNRNLGEDNILATLEHRHRVCQIEIWNISRSLWENALPLIQKPFLILTDLNLRCSQYTDDRITSAIPDSFLGGYAPRLQQLHLECIPFPGLPSLLLSTTDLVHLELNQIPDSGYISAEAMATCLSTLTRLESFMLCFKSPRPFPQRERRRSSSSTRTLLPSLTRFTFQGVSEYLEDIVDGIDAPLLYDLTIGFFHQPIFDAPQLAQLIGRLPNFKICHKASMHLGRSYDSIEVLSFSKKTIPVSLLLEDQHGQPDLLLLPLVHFCTSSLPRALITTVEELSLYGDSFSRPSGQDGIEPRLWRELLRPFTAVKDLHLASEFAPHIALVLQELVGESVMELLPVLQNIFLRGMDQDKLVPEGIERFITARQLAGHPISVLFTALFNFDPL